MTIVERLRAAGRYLSAWAEAVEYDPVKDLYRRVGWLERQVGAGDLPHLPIDAHRSRHTAPEVEAIHLGETRT